MKLYGRIQNGVVAELVSTDSAISTMFHPGLVWVDLTGQPGVAPGWLWNGNQASPPAASAAVMVASPATLAELQSQISSLQARLVALTPATVPGTAA